MSDYAASREDTSQPRGLRIAANAGNASESDAGRNALSTSIQNALARVDRELGVPNWLFQHPERRKALSRSRQFLQQIFARLDYLAPQQLQLAIALIERSNQTATMRGRENAWDYAEDLRVMSFEFLSDAELAVLLAKEAADTTPINYQSLFGRALPQELLDPGSADFRATGLAVLRRLHEERVDRVRHDRAHDRLFALFLLVLVPNLGVLLIACLTTYEWNPSAKMLPVLAGALGSELSAVLSLRDGKQGIRHLRRSSALFIVQALIGATAALAMQWIGAHELLKLGDNNGDARVIVGFLAGFSEPFFLGTLRRLSELGATPPPKIAGPAQ